jgi:transmembrane 9 superfamily protein 2/4
MCEREASVRAVGVCAAEESGWKLVHADVLRPPPLPLLLCASIGTGSQLLGMSLISIVCAMLGFLSPANRGGLLTATLLLFTLMGVPAGYVASSTYKSLRGSQWKTLTLLTAMLYPGTSSADQTHRTGHRCCCCCCC